MKSIYNFGIYCYKQLVALAGIRNVKARKLTQGQKGIFDYLSRHADPQGGYLWIHASSLGEFEQGRPLIEAIKKSATRYQNITHVFLSIGLRSPQRLFRSRSYLLPSVRPAGQCKTIPRLDQTHESHIY